MDKPESFIPSFNILLEPFHDGQRDFNSGIGRECQMSVDQRLSEPDATANIQQVEPRQVRSTYSSSQSPEQRFSSLFDPIRQYIGGVALQVGGNNNAIQVCHSLNSSH